MPNSVRFNIVKKEISNAGLTLDETEFDIYTNYSESMQQNVTIASNNTWIPFSFSQIATCSSVSIISDQTIDIELNGGPQVISGSTLIFDGTVTSLRLRNNSGYSSLVTLYIYGDPS